MSRSDVVVVGGGIIGCAVARRLAQRGVTVRVVERAVPGGEASWAAAGMLAPLVEADGPGPFLELLLRSREMYPEMVRGLRDETGMDPGYSDAGMLSLALSEAEVHTLERRERWQREAGLDVERLGADALLALEPALSREVRMALRFPGDHQVDNRILSRALWSAAAAAGVRFDMDRSVAGISSDAGRVTGVDLSGGGRIDAAAVVVAAGSWSGQLNGLPRPLPLHPVHGQLVAIEVLPPRFRHTVTAPGCYLVPRLDGRVIVGATVERVGFRKAVTPGGLLALLGCALRVAPWLRDLPVLESWSGLRPGTPDGLPVLGPDPALEGLHWATGHFRNGILLAPITADLVSASILGAPPALDLAPFRPDRFPAPGRD